MSKPQTPPPDDAPRLNLPPEIRSPGPIPPGSPSDSAGYDFPSENEEDGWEEDNLGEGEEIDIGEEAAAAGESSPHPEPALSRGMTFVSSVLSYQSPYEEPEGSPVKFSFFNASQEQVYRRESKVGTTWQQLDAGWFRDAVQDVTDPASGKTVSQPVPVIVQIINCEGLRTGRQPTRQEVEDLAGRIIEVGYAVPVPPTREDEQERDARRRTRTMWDEPEPIREERGEEGRRQVRVVAVAQHYIPPGEDCRINPVSLSSVYLRCVRGEARYSLRIVPR